MAGYPIIILDISIVLEREREKERERWRDEWIAFNLINPQLTH